MARPKKDAPIDLSVTHELSYGLIERLTCPVGVPKAFLRDRDVTGLKVRVTANGAKSFVFEAKLNGKAISKTIGGFPLMTIEDAKDRARALATMVKSDKIDPRDVLRQQELAKAAEIASAAAMVEVDKAAAVTVGEVWTAYLADRKERWGDRHYADHLKLSDAGGLPFKRGTGTTKPAPLAELMPLKLRDLTASVIEVWAAKEAKVRATSARLSWRLLKGFLGWCEEQPTYADLLPAKNPAKTKKSREALGRVTKKKDVLQREQLPAWFAAVKNIGNPCISAYLQVLLLTGARPGEIITMRWENVNTQWNGLTIRDKADRVTRERTIPLTPYVAHLLANLPRVNEWVFASSRTLNMSPANVRRRETRHAVEGKTLAAGEIVHSSATGHITEPNNAHTTACAVSGIHGLTLHGLRRSFKSSSEWIDIPNGVRQNIMGHVAKSTDEDYTVRPLDLLRMHHERIEAWILGQAGIVFDAKAKPGQLRVVAN